MEEERKSEKAPDAVSVTSSKLAAASEAARLEELKSRYVPLIPPEEQTEPYRSKMVGLNPKLKPPVSASRANLFPMAGLWS